MSAVDKISGQTARAMGSAKTYDPDGEVTRTITYKPSLICKLLSGRFFLCVCAGVSLVGLTYAFILRGSAASISGEALASIITMVFMSYFGKKRD